MSAWMTMADAVKTRLESLAALAGVDVVVDRQKSISSMVAAAVGKAKGACVTILFDGAELTDDSGLATRPRFIIRLYAKPVIRDNDPEAVPADDILEAMLPALHHWSPKTRPTCYDLMEISNPPAMLPDSKWLIYQFELTGRATLPAPEFLT